MIISPPFLPVRSAAQLDADWLMTAMNGGIPGQGGYPVSFNLGWHGGIHLDAPMLENSRVSQAIRAIADGKVIYVRQPTPRPPSPIPDDHPLNYRGGWTSDGCVIIKHETEIGATADGVATKVTYYSIIMHLNSIVHAVRKNQPIYRKDEIGQAGYIYNATNKIHFEIICDDDNLKKLTGRSTGKLDISKDGRTDAVYGEMYFHLPTGAPVYAEHPLPQLAVAHKSASVPLSPKFTTTEPMIVGLRYAGGEGAVNQRGDAVVSSYQLDGKTIGTALREADAEYNLYTSANKISKAYPDGAEPAPSAVYELLRFGRVINTTQETLTPADVPHWREINYPGGSGWVNLNATGITKFSDADFPHWQGWQLIDDDTDLNSLCNSATIKGWLDEDHDGEVDPNEALSRLSNDKIQDRLKRTICKFPTEWEQATMDARWEWLTEESPENLAPISKEDFLRLREHIETLCFWEEANIGISSKHWHFQPREFIRHMRLCGWLSGNPPTKSGVLK